MKKYINAVFFLYIIKMYNIILKIFQQRLKKILSRSKLTANIDNFDIAKAIGNNFNIFKIHFI